MKTIKPKTTLTVIVSFLSFACINTATAQWSTSGANIYNSNTGNIGIGTNAPAYKLHTKGDIYLDGGWLRVSGNTGLYFQNWGGGFYMSDNNWIRTYTNNGIWNGTGIIGTNGGFSSGYNGSAPPASGAIIAGNVGIGTKTPRGKLSIDGSATHNYLTIDADLAYQSSLSYGDHTNGQDIVCFRPENTRDYCIWTSTVNSALYVKQTGNVGIGTSTPLSKFVVQDGFGYTQMRIDGSLSPVGYSYTSPTGGIRIAGFSGNGTPAEIGGIRFNLVNGTTGSEAGSITLSTANNGIMSPKMVIDNIGNVGIGTTAPGANLSFNDVTASTTTDGITWYNPAPTAYGIYRSAGSWTGPDYQQLHLTWATGIVLDGGGGYGKSGVVMQPAGGYVGIGTTSPHYPLDVNGVIRANEVKVCSFGTCDFVFEKNYNLMQVDSLSAYLNQNHHLPGIASAKEMESEGTVSLGKMNSQLLQKVEELTLYIIEQDKEIKELKKYMKK